MFLGRYAAMDKRKIISNLSARKSHFGVYAIVLATNEKDLLDVISAFFLKDARYHKKNIEVVGLAIGRDEAFEVVRDIITEVYDKTGGFDVRGFFS